MKGHKLDIALTEYDLFKSLHPSNQLKKGQIINETWIANDMKNILL